jgi:hypothetical protein
MEAGHVVVGERRTGPDRRVRRVSLRYPERRSGFDRRAERDASSVRATYADWIRRIAASPVRYGTVAAAIFVLNMVDLLLTYRALERGAIELNPVMAALLDAGYGVAGVVKIGVSALVVVLGWRLRRYRRVVEVSLLLAVVLGAVVLYHLAAPAIF